MSEEKKYYWLKLKRDFFKRHDIRIIEDMENGKDYVLFYLKLLLESIDHDGNLRFSETIPYNEKMLSTITGTNIDVVRSAVKLFTELKMMDRMDDGTLYMNQIEQMTGSETRWADKKRLYRKNSPEIDQKEDNVLTMSSLCPHSVPSMSDKSKSIEKEIRDREEEASPEAPPPPSFQPRNVHTPNNSTSRIDKLRIAWNYAGLPECRYTVINFRDFERSDCMRAISFYTDEEIEKAIQNYAGIAKSADHEIFPYKGFTTFMAKGVEQFIDKADPWTTKKRRETEGEKKKETEYKERGGFEAPERTCPCCGNKWSSTMGTCPKCHYDEGDTAEHREWYFGRFGERLPEL